MRIVLIASVFVLSGCGIFGEGGLFGDGKPAKAPDKTSTAASSEKLTITKATWAAYENYRYWLTPIAWERRMGEGYFAVAKDGRSWGLTGCSANDCVVGAPISQDAVDICQTRSGGVPCLVFARDHDIIVPYEVAD